MVVEEEVSSAAAAFTFNYSGGARFDRCVGAGLSSLPLGIVRQINLAAPTLIGRIIPSFCCFFFILFGGILREC